MENQLHLCPCCSGNAYDNCCKPFHTGSRPENALQLMRSRYAAYALNIASYIIATTHTANPQYSKNMLSWKRSISQFSHSTTFHRLEIIDFKENALWATVTFTACLSQDTRDTTFTERSHFEKVKGAWLYRDGSLAQGHQTPPSW